MKILLIGPLPPPITGNSIINNKIICNFSKYYDEVDVDFINIGVPTFNSQAGEASIKKLLLYISQYKSLYKVCFTNVVYVSIGHTFLGILKYLPFFITAKIFRKNLIIHVHTDYLWLLYENSTPFKKKLLKYTMSLVDKGIVLSPLLRRNLIPFMNNKKIYELPNFITGEIMNHNISNTIANKNYDKTKILFLSNLIKEKGIIDFLEAMLLLKEENIDFEVHVAGDIPIYMQKEINIYFEQLKDIIFYHGVVQSNQKNSLFLASNIFIFPTLREAQPLVLLEAMATGNIILSTNVGGISDIFKNSKNGITIDTHNPLQIKDKILEINNKKNNFNDMLHYNYSEIKKKYTEKKFFETLYKIIMD